MPRKVQVKVDGRDVDAVEISFTIKREEWNEYELADGGRVRMRSAVHRILQVLDEDGKPARNPAGELMMVVQSQNAVVVSE